MERRTPPGMPRRRPSATLLFALAGAAWILWVLLRSVLGPQATDPVGPVPAVPAVPAVLVVLALGAGVVLGRLSTRPALTIPAAALLVVLAASILLLSDLYANARAAIGVQLLAVAGLLATGARTSTAPGRRRPKIALAAGLAALALLLAAGSQAAALLAVPLAVVVGLALSPPPLPSPRSVLTLGASAITSSAVAVLILGVLPHWPAALRAGTSLSRARQELWRDALELWRAHPLLGGGRGSFPEHSAVSRSEDHLYAVHSSILQAGAELGVVGVILFLALLGTGLAVAARGDRSAALIGVTAWSALAVHSMVDHLYEFALLDLVAGLVLGWASARRPGRPGRPEPSSADASRHVRLPSS